MLKIISNTICIFAYIMAVNANSSTIKKFSRSAIFESVSKDKKSYENCLKRATRKFKKTKAQKSKRLKVFKRETQACKERYPAADHYKKCKKQAIRNKTKNFKAAKVKLKLCKKDLLSSTKVGKSNFPIFLNKKENEVIFAGIGIEKELSLKNLAPPGFECFHAKEVLSNVSPPVYALLGNDIKSFTTKKFSKTKFARILGTTTQKNNEKEFDDKYLVRYIKNDDKITVYFPLISCSLKERNSQTYENIKLYYILDPKSKSAIPYFGVAFYRSEGPKNIDKKLSNTFDKKFIARQSDAMSTVFFAEKLEEVDDNSDPYNICKYRKNNKFLAITQNKTKNSEKIAYLLLANIENLCEYGGRHFSGLK